MTSNTKNKLNKYDVTSMTSAVSAMDKRKIASLKRALTKGTLNLDSKIIAEKMLAWFSA